MDNFQFIYKNRELYKIMLHDIRNSQKYVYLETYIFSDDKIGKRFKDELEKAAARGVEVKLLLDDYGTSLGYKYFKKLSELGAEVRFFRKLKFAWQLIKKNNNRDHRKILVIDDRICYTGSSNICHRMIDWWELNIRMKGRISLKFKDIFLLNFKIYNKKIYKKKEHTKKIVYNDIEIIRDVPSIRIRKIRKKKLELIKGAQKRIVIETPYFIPEPLLVRQLRRAIKRGVKITVLVPKKSDVKMVDIAGRKYLALLHKLGVEVRHYRPSVLHSKAILVDDAKFLFGSANIDPRSSILQFEINISGQNKEMAHQLKEHLEYASRYAEDFNFNKWRNRSWLTKIAEKILDKIIDLL